MSFRIQTCIKEILFQPGFPLLNPKHTFNLPYNSYCACYNCCNSFLLNDPAPLRFSMQVEGYLPSDCKASTGSLQSQRLTACLCYEQCYTWPWLPNYHYNMVWALVNHGQPPLLLPISAEISELLSDLILLIVPLLLHFHGEGAQKAVQKSNKTSIF